MVASMLLGPAALDPAYPLLNAAIAGTVVHLFLSAAFGGIFGLIAVMAPILVRSAAAAIGSGLIYGCLIWLVNFVIIAPAADWTWFVEETNPLARVVAHTAFYGAPLGLFLWANTAMTGGSVLQRLFRRSSGSTPNA
jgi:hypothetical protein